MSRGRPEDLSDRTEKCRRTVAKESRAVANVRDPVGVESRQGGIFGALESEAGTVDNAYINERARALPLSEANSPLILPHPYRLTGNFPSCGELSTGITLENPQRHRAFEEVPL